MTWRIVRHQDPVPDGISEDDWKAFGPLELKAFAASGDEAGYLRWQQVLDGEDIPCIVKITTHLEYVRQGVASALFDEFLRLYPTGEVYLGTFLHDGRLWWPAYQHRRDLDRSRFTLQHGEEDPMDPNETLKQLREALAAARAAENRAEDAAEDQNDAAETHERFAVEESMSRAAERIEALDEWLSKGGFLPDEWATKPSAPWVVIDHGLNGDEPAVAGPYPNRAAAEAAGAGHRTTITPLWTPGQLQENYAAGME